MNRNFHAFLMCHSMFCVIPFPWKTWDEKAKGRMMLFLPLVGLEIGVIWAGLAWLCLHLHLPAMITGMILCAYPYMVTGYIHLDGFMDVTDAVKSWRDLDRRREILKDSHVGSFAVIACILLMIAQFSLFASMPQNANLFILMLIPVVSRCGSALAVTILPSMHTSQYAQQEKPKSHQIILMLILCVAIALGFLLCGTYGFALLGGLVGYGLALRRAYTSLQGMNGDISGYALILSELVAIAVFVLI